jgi:hypothetical protein
MAHGSAQAAVGQVQNALMIGYVEEACRTVRAGKMVNFGPERGVSSGVGSGGPIAPGENLATCTRRDKIQETRPEIQDRDAKMRLHEEILNFSNSKKKTISKGNV